MRMIVTGRLMRKPTRRSPSTGQVMGGMVTAVAESLKRGGPQGAAEEEKRIGG
jgi:hypothetical protein